MSEYNIEDELDRTKILMDIYKNENEQIKYEYRVLWDKYSALQTTVKYLEEDIEKYENSRSIKLVNRIKKMKIIKLLRKIKKSLKGK